jgi:hypothetical protein
MERFAGDEILPGVNATDDAALDDAIREHAESAYHPCGTCRMGRADDPGAVVDPQARVIGVDGLRLADSSIFPQVTNGNTNAPSIMVGEKAADHILGRDPLPRDNRAPWIAPDWRNAQRESEAETTARLSVRSPDPQDAAEGGRGDLPPPRHGPEHRAGRRGAERRVEVRQHHRDGRRKPRRRLQHRHEIRPAARAQRHPPEPPPARVVDTPGVVHRLVEGQKMRLRPGAADDALRLRHEERQGQRVDGAGGVEADGDAGPVGSPRKPRLEGGFWAAARLRLGHHGDPCARRSAMRHAGPVGQRAGQYTAQDDLPRGLRRGHVGEDRAQPPDPRPGLAPRLQRAEELVAPIRRLLPLTGIVGLAEAQVLREAAGDAPVAGLLRKARVGMEQHGQTVGVPVGQRLHRGFRGAADLVQQVGQRDGGARQAVTGQKQRFVDDPVGGETIERGIEAGPEPLGQRRLPVGVAQRDVQDVMRGQPHLFGQSQRREAGAIDDGIAHGPRRPLPVAMPAPERQDGKRGVDLSQMGERAGGAGGVAGHSPTASRSLA